LGSSVEHVFPQSSNRPPANLLALVVHDLHQSLAHLRLSQLVVYNCAVSYQQPEHRAEALLQNRRLDRLE
jgi:hypothetical protein